MTKNEMKHTKLNITGRDRLTLDGVDHIISFDEGYVTLDLGECRLNVEGEGLKIESLSHNEGEIVIVGRVDGLFYSKEKKVKTGIRRLLG